MSLYSVGLIAWVPGGSALVKNLPVRAGGARDLGSIPGSGRFPGGGHGNPLQYSCLETPRDRGAWWTAVYGVEQGRTQLKRLSSSSSSVSIGCQILGKVLHIHTFMNYQQPAFLAVEE